MATRLYRRKAYLDKMRPFVDDTGIIKVVTGIRRCGKSCLMQTVAEEIVERGIPTKNIVFIDLEKRGLRRIKTPDQLEATIEEHIPSKIKGTIYLFIDEIQRVEGFEEVINAYRADGRFSIFITGSNSYHYQANL